MTKIDYLLKWSILLLLSLLLIQFSHGYLFIWIDKNVFQ